MRVEQIPAHEADFEAHYTDCNGKLFDHAVHTIQIPGEETTMDYVVLTPRSGDKTFYYGSVADKKQIVLHYTLGYLKGDIATLTQHDYHVSVPFVIGRNGMIYNLFDPHCWAYHLGPNAVGGNATSSKRTIGIEISNIGGLKRTNYGMETYYGDIYCRSDQNDAYVQQPFRRFDYFATFTPEQYESLILLIRYLTASFPIRRNFLDSSDRFKVKNNIPGFRGIVSHVNYRRSDKEDIGPAFDWERVIQGVMQ